MSDETFRFAISPIVTERNARRLVDILAQSFPSSGTTCEELRRVFEKATGLKRQMFYDTLAYSKHREWVIGGGVGRPYQLNPNGCWKPPPLSSAGEKLEKDRLAHAVDSQTRRIAELQGEVDSLRDWSKGDDADGANVALSSLLRIVSDNTASPRQRIRAASTILSYKVQDSDAVEFTTRFLRSVCTSADIATDYRIEAGELLRKHEAPRIASESVRPSYSDDGGTEANRIEAWRTFERWQLRREIMFETRDPPKPGWDDHLLADTYKPPEGTSMPPVRVVTDPTSGFRLLDNLMPGPGPRRIGNGAEGDEPSNTSSE
jgi:hypothetical protein